MVRGFCYFSPLVVKLRKFDIMKPNELFNALIDELEYPLAIVVYDCYMGEMSLYLIPLLESLPIDTLDEITSYAIPHSTLCNVVDFLTRRMEDEEGLSAHSPEHGIDIFHQLYFDDDEENTYSNNIDCILKEDVVPMYTPERSIQKELARVAEEFVETPEVEMLGRNTKKHSSTVDGLLNIYMKEINKVWESKEDEITQRHEENARAKLYEIAEYYIRKGK